MHGTEILVFAVCYAGDMDEGERALAPLRALGKPMADVVGPQPYAGWQTAFDPLLTPGARNYWKSHDFGGSATDRSRSIIDTPGRLPTPECEIFIGPGRRRCQPRRRPTRPPTRIAMRSYIMNVHARWRDPAEDERVSSGLGA